MKRRGERGALTEEDSDFIRRTLAHAARVNLPLHGSVLHLPSVSESPRPLVVWPRALPGENTNDLPHLSVPPIRPPFRPSFTCFPRRAARCGQSAAVLAHFLPDGAAAQLAGLPACSFRHRHIAQLRLCDKTSHNKPARSHAGCPVGYGISLNHAQKENTKASYRSWPVADASQIA